MASALRVELESARRAYAASAYPGDLSAELLRPRVGWRGLLTVGMTGSALVAAAAMFGAFALRPILHPAPPGRPGIPLVRDFPSALRGIGSIPDPLRFAPALPLPAGMHLPWPSRPRPTHHAVSPAEA